MGRIHIIALILAAIVSSGASSEPLTYEQHIRPIFKAVCFHCHGEANETEGGLDVRLVRLMIAGGESGAAIVPGDAEASLLWKRIAADEMPKGEKKLSQSDKDLVREWIIQGARTARPEPEDPNEARFILEELNHWAFQSVSDPDVPLGQTAMLNTPIDAFIAGKLAEEGFSFSPEADRETLLRRATMDLSGLLPTIEERECFVRDESPDAYSRLVDRLLASPQFGVRWGRHWFDVAGYAESDGNAEGDTKRAHAWRYRDYVIDAFNNNKPINEFIVEQLAGDELIDGELDVHNERQRELLTATGFLRMAPDTTQRENTLTNRNTAVADAIQVVSTSILGLTVGCAQCHDHKYDPIGIDDYYRFRAVFDPAFPIEKWRTPNQRLVDMTKPDVRAVADRIEAEAKKLEDDLNERRRERGKEIQELKLADVPESDRNATRTAVLTEVNKRTAEQKALLDLYPMVKPVPNILGLLIEYDMPAYRKFEKEQQAIAAVRATKPPARLIMATRERPDIVPVSRILFRGNPESPGDEVKPAELMVLNRQGSKFSVPSKSQSTQSTGRRLAYALHLTSGTHPMTARVFVNRLWQHHFGRGIVATPNDFGLIGERPSHPSLLDWLAQELVRHEWDQKRLHRLIMLSTTYRQVSTRRPDVDAVDPENALFGRANLRRLDAEAIRDALLGVSGQLSLVLGGPSVPVTQSGEGKAVIGVQKIRDGLEVGADGSGADANRRSVYIQHLRHLPLNVLTTFDLPNMAPNCDRRQLSTVATQALWFMNDEFIVERAEALANEISIAAQEPRTRLHHLFLTLFNKPPTDADHEVCLEFLSNDQTLASLCQVLLASNRFLYVD